METTGWIMRRLLGCKLLKQRKKSNKNMRRNRNFFRILLKMTQKEKPIGRSTGKRRFKKPKSSKRLIQT